MTSFSEWLENELHKRGISPAEFSRMTQKHESVISRILKGTKPRSETLEIFARALRLPPEIVYRAASGSPSKPNDDETIEEIIYDLRSLPEHEIVDIRDIIKAKLGRYEREGNKDIARKTKHMG
jgi:predicted transcriptional regulator